MSFTFDFQLDEDQPQGGENIKKDFENRSLTSDLPDDQAQTNNFITTGVENLNLDVNSSSITENEIQEDNLTFTNTSDRNRIHDSNEFNSTSYEVSCKEESFDEENFYWLDFYLKWDINYANNRRIQSKEEDMNLSFKRGHPQQQQQQQQQENVETPGNDIHFIIVDKDVREAIDDVGRGVDLVAGKYEGGFKIWEGTRDLLHYLQKSEISMGNGKISKEFNLPATTCNEIMPLNALKRLKDYNKIMDLGCGHGLLGLYSLQKGSKDVTFTDYNRECLTDLAFPNVMKNYSCLLNQNIELNNQNDENIDKTSIRYYYGDWEKVSKTHLYPEEIVYDLILSAETVYTQEVTLKVVNFLKSHLSSPSKYSSSCSRSIEDKDSIKGQQDRDQGGIALIAGKRYYFGTGGGTGYLMHLLKEDSELAGEVVATFENGKSNIREIVLVKKK